METPAFGRDQERVVALRPSIPGIVAALALLFFGHAAEAADRRVALVLGNSNYRYAPALTTPANDAEDIAAWGARLGASERTLTRRFQSELGMNFREWKRRLRLFKSMELLGAGMSVTATALELGYGSPSAFSYMFTREMGCSPKTYRAAPGRERQRSARSRAR